MARLQSQTRSTNEASRWYRALPANEYLREPAALSGPRVMCVLACRF